MTTATTTPAPAALTAAQAADLRAQYAAQRAKGLRAKDAAEAAGSSEGQAIAAHAQQLIGATDGLQVRPLGTAWVEMLQALEACGTVMALTSMAAVASHE